MYTTNIIEGFHRLLRAVTKSKGAFQSEDALMKLLFLAKRIYVPSGINQSITGIKLLPNYLLYLVID